jgi:tetrahydromethanopterin S-methyltransferase subunit F
VVRFWHHGYAYRQVNNLPSTKPDKHTHGAKSEPLHALIGALIGITQKTDLRRIEEMVADIVTEMEYLRAREQRLRDTNESTKTISSMRRRSVSTGLSFSCDWMLFQSRASAPMSTSSSQ